jgi:hypothetical protein
VAVGFGDVWRIKLIAQFEEGQHPLLLFRSGSSPASTCPFRQALALRSWLNPRVDLTVERLAKSDVLVYNSGFAQRRQEAPQVQGNHWKATAAADGGHSRSADEQVAIKGTVKRFGTDGRQGGYSPCG